MTSKTSNRLAAIACVAAGILIAALPHFAGWTLTGRPYYVATIDDRFYLAIASQAYFNHPGRIADPVFVAGGTSLYRALQFLPGVWGAKLLGLDPLEIGLMWRVIAGATVGFGWYTLFRLKVERPWIAASLAVMLLGDSGLTHGLPLIRLGLTAVAIASKSPNYFQGGHWIHLEWRSVTPAMTMVYLLALVWSVLRAREAPTRWRIALAGLTFGLVFYVWFYYWTAAGLALLFALALDAGHRRIYFHVGWLGGLMGLPIVVSDFLLKQSLPSVTDCLNRCDRFVTIGRLEGVELQKDWLVIPALSLAWVLIRQRDLIFVWALGMAGLVLENHQVLTRLQLENYHWAYVWGPAFSYLITLAVASEIGERLNWSPRTCVGFGVVGLAAFGVGLWIRWVEATGSDTVATARTITAYCAEFSPGRHSRFAPNAVAAGDRDFVDFAAILDNLRPLDGFSAYLSCSLTNAELDDREALNELLQGVDRAAFEAKQPRELVKYKSGPWYHDRSLIPSRVADRVAAYDRARANLPAALDRMAVRYVGVRNGARLDYVTQGWALIASGPTWDVWERIAPPAALTCSDYAPQFLLCLPAHGKEKPGVVWTTTASGFLGLVAIFTPGLMRPLHRLLAGLGHSSSILHDPQVMAATYRGRLGILGAILVLSSFSDCPNVVGFYLIGRILFATQVPSLAEHFLLVPLVFFTTAAPLPFGALELSERLFRLVAQPGGALTMMGIRILLYGSGLLSACVYLANLRQARDLTVSANRLLQNLEAMPSANLSS